MWICIIIIKPYEINKNFEYISPRLIHRAPDWLDEVDELDPDLAGLLREVCLAANDSQVRLLSMGVRAVLDRVMDMILGRDEGSFRKKLGRMVEEGHLSRSQKEHLETVIDAGSASSHRAFRPP
jgi:hypothetical protein